MSGQARQKVHYDQSALTDKEQRKSVWSANSVRFGNQTDDTTQENYKKIIAKRC